jgi:hypothetical protein
MDTFLSYLAKEKEKKEPFKGEKAYTLVEKMLPFIGHEDPHVRDDIVYVCLAIVSERLTHDERSKLLDIYLSREFLFYQIKSTEEGDALRRTFTLLQLAVLLYYHHQEQITDPVFVDKIADALTQYLGQENVLKGYDEQMGWIHAIAHSADVLGQLLVAKELKEEKQVALLDAFVSKFQEAHYTYIDNEDERLVTALEKGWKSGHLKEEVIRDFIGKLPMYESPSHYKGLFVVQNNVKHLLRSLFFRFEDQVDWVEDIRQAMQKNKDHKKS